jgi:hypothetical protein
MQQMKNCHHPGLEDVRTYYNRAHNHFPFFPDLLLVARSPLRGGKDIHWISDWICRQDYSGATPFIAILQATRCTIVT